MASKHYLVLLQSVLFLLIALLIAGNAHADNRTQAKRIHDRLTGIVPSAAVLNTMEGLLDGSITITAAGYPNVQGNAAIGATAEEVAAAYIAMEDKNFSNATLVNFITPWTNEAQTAFPGDMGTEGILNDYTATVIGAINDQIDFRRILYDNILYMGKASLGLTNNTYGTADNNHYKELEERAGKDLSQDLEQVVQTATNGLPAGTASGVLTSRAAAKAFFVDGTNRAMIRFTALNHLCQDMEQFKDNSLPADRIRQDVSRSPGGDSRIYMNECIGCHTGMDPLTQAFAYYDYDYPPDMDGDGNPDYEDGQLVFNGAGVNDTDRDGNDTGTNSQVQLKNLINADNFKPGYVTTDDSWTNYWRQGKNSVIGDKVDVNNVTDNWDASLADPGSNGASSSGNGASSMAKELAHSEMFARCQVEKVFKTVCFRPPVDSADRLAVNAILANFKSPYLNTANTEGYELKRVFAETAVYCKGP